MTVTKRKIADITVEELHGLVDFWVEEKLIELYGDPDDKLRLKPDVLKRLKQSQAAVKRGERGIPVAEVARKLDLRF